MIREIPTQIISPTPKNLESVTALLMAGEIVALPTETVYGLAGNATQASTVQKIFAAKKRPHFDPLIVHVWQNTLEQLVSAEIISAEVLKWKNKALIQNAMDRYWPGPLTFILPRGKKIPDLVTASQDTVGVRMPAHLLFQAVLSRLDFPLAAPSANLFGKISPTQAEHVLQELNGRIPAILDGGPCEVGVESTIIKVTEDHITLLRPGKISESELEEVFEQSLLKLKKSLDTENTTTILRMAPLAGPPLLSPGSLDEHYAPSKPLYLIDQSLQTLKGTHSLQALLLSTHAAGSLIPKNAKIGLIKMAPAHTDAQFKLAPVSLTRQHTLSEHGSCAEMAQTLFQVMRDFDQDPNVDFIIVDIPPLPKPTDREAQGLRAAICDRLNRASQNKPL